MTLTITKRHLNVFPLLSEMNAIEQAEGYIYSMAYHTSDFGIFHQCQIIDLD